MEKKIPWQKIKSEQYSSKEIKELEMRVHLKVALKKLREERERLGMTQEQVAKKSGLPRTTISKIESGFQNASLLKIMQVAEALDKEIEITFCDS